MRKKKRLKSAAFLVFISKILQLTAVNVVGVREGEKVHRFDDIGKLASFADAAFDEHFFNEF